MTPSKEGIDSRPDPRNLGAGLTLLATSGTCIRASSEPEGKDVADPVPAARLDEIGTIKGTAYDWNLNAVDDSR